MTGDGAAGGRERSVASNGRIAFHYAEGSNLVVMKYLYPDMVSNAEDAAFLIDTFEMLARTRTALGFLVDCTNLGNTDPGWRATVSDYFQRRAPIWPAVAWYDTTVTLQVTVEMFAIATRPGIEGKHFTSEAAARAWLRDQGIG